MFKSPSSTSAFSSTSKPNDGPFASSFRSSLDAFRQKTSGGGTGPAQYIRSFFGGGDAGQGSTGSGTGRGSTAQYTPLLGIQVNQPSMASPSASSAGAGETRSGFNGFIDRIKPASMLRQPHEDGIFGTLTWTQRMVGFGLCVGFGALCFFLAFMMLPVAVLKPGKFASLFTFGSLLTFFSFSFLRGFSTHWQSLLSSERRVQTAAYLGSMLFTLYACLGIGSYLFILFSIFLQLLAIAWYIRSYWPGQATSSGLQFMIRRSTSLV